MSSAEGTACTSCLEIQDINLRGHYFVYGLLSAVAACEPRSPDTSCHIYRGAFGYRREVRHPFAAPCHHVVPGGLDHALVVLAFVDEVCGHGESGHFAFPDFRDTDITHVPPQFYSVQLFHNDVFLKSITDRRYERSMPAGCKVMHKISNGSRRRICPCRLFLFFHVFSVFLCAALLPGVIKNRKTFLMPA